MMSQAMRERVPYDVVNDIFGLLPVKSLTRFRSVSKTCNSIISDPTFISTHFNLNLNLTKSLTSTNTHSGYLLYTPTVTVTEDHSSSTSKQLCTVVCNDPTLPPVSKFEIPPIFDEFSIVGFCNSVFCLASYDQDLNHIIYLWNPSIRKFKKLRSTLFLYSNVTVVFGFAFDSKNNDFKVLRLITFREKKPQAEAEIYTLSTDSWRKVILTMESLRGYEPNFGSIVSILPRSVFCNGALHFIANTCVHHFILSFDVHDETFHEMKMPLPQNYALSFQLAVFKGLLAIIYFFHGLCHFWVMEEYGVVGSWTRKFLIPMDSPHDFYCCTDNGELIFKSANGLVSINPPRSRSILAIEDANWVGFSANSMESLVLLDQGTLRRIVAVGTWKPPVRPNPNQASSHFPPSISSLV
ncbi:F-box/kelch-repeat protein At3g23880-like [Castanea sativa]|uniref:F-box/kelch-repeat protein At3g23880-like n=1 Tax=Castanea sativa TaxID=21020 RepID=UPI003F64B08B